MTVKPYKFTAQKKAKFLDLIRKGQRRGAAARAVGVTRHTIAIYMREDPEFRGEVDDAEMEANEVVEDALYKAATKGGNVVAQQVWLYNRSPDRWADRRKIDLNTKVDLGRMTPEQIAERAAALGINRAYRLPHEPSEN